MAEASSNISTKLANSNCATYQESYTSIVETVSSMAKVGSYIASSTNDVNPQLSQSKILLLFVGIRSLLSEGTTRLFLSCAYHLL